MQCCIHLIKLRHGGKPSELCAFRTEKKSFAQVFPPKNLELLQQRPAANVGLAHSIIGWGFRWKGTAGEKAFLEGEMVLVRGRKALFSDPQ